MANTFTSVCAGLAYWSKLMRCEHLWQGGASLDEVKEEREDNYVSGYSLSLCLPGTVKPAAVFYHIPLNSTRKPLNLGSKGDSFPLFSVGYLSIIWRVDQMLEVKLKTNLCWWNILGSIKLSAILVIFPKEEKYYYWVTWNSCW